MASVYSPCDISDMGILLGTSLFLDYYLWFRYTPITLVCQYCKTVPYIGLVFAIGVHMHCVWSREVWSCFNKKPHRCCVATEQVGFCSFSAPWFRHCCCFIMQYHTLSVIFWFWLALKTLFYKNSLSECLQALPLLLFFFPVISRTVCTRRPFIYMYLWFSEQVHAINKWLASEPTRTIVMQSLTYSFLFL